MSYMGYPPRGGNLFTKDTLLMLGFLLILLGLIIGGVWILYALAGLA
jgi:hypothetical protein